MSSIFEISNPELDRLASDFKRSTEFFRELLHAEATKLGVAYNKITISNNIDAPDDGLDATATVGDYIGNEGLIVSGYNGYQIKAGHTFSPTNNELKNEIYKNGNPSLDNLKPKIKECLEKEGRYVVVCIGKDINDKQKSAAEKYLKEEFKKYEFLNCNVEVWGQGHLIGFINQFLGLVISLKGADVLSIIQPFKEWANDPDMKTLLSKSPDYDKKREEIHDVLISKDCAKHIRIIEYAGLGKTRFVLESLRFDDMY